MNISEIEKDVLGRCPMGLIVDDDDMEKSRTSSDNDLEDRDVCGQPHFSLFFYRKSGNAECTMDHK